MGNWALEIRGDSKTFYSGDLLGKIHQWDIASGKQLRTLDASVLHTRKENFLADIGGVKRIALSDDGNLLACSGIEYAANHARTLASSLIISCSSPGF